MKNHFPKQTLGLIALAAFLVVPSLISLKYLNDRRVLNETLEYLYAPDYAKVYDIDESSLKRTIQTVRSNKANRQSFGNGRRKPFLSSYFNWLVLDNLTLSDSKIKHIESVFFDMSRATPIPENIRQEGVELSAIWSESTYDEVQAAWRTWLHLEMTNCNEAIRQSEYSTTFNLPAGCWISDHYLYVGERKEMGILSEKRTAMWVFSEIRNIRRDPSILYYLTGNQVAFRVFPFRAKEVRKTAIEFLHKEAVELDFDGEKIRLGYGKQAQTSQIVETAKAAYIPASQKTNLEQITRKSYLHFLVDASSSSEFSDETVLEKDVISPLFDKYPELKEAAKISYVDSKIKTIAANDNWLNAYQPMPSEGGFFAERAMQQVLVEAYQADAAAYPILVLVTNKFEAAILQKDFSDLAFAYPESAYFYVTNGSNLLEKHDLRNKVRQALETITPDSLLVEKPVCIYEFEDGERAFLADDGKASIAIPNRIFDFQYKDTEGKQWQTGLEMEAAWMEQQIYPALADKQWLPMLKQVFDSQIMNPLTSYLALENEAQKAALKQKQKQVLKGNSKLDLSERVNRMSEPDLWLLFGLMLLFLWYRRL